MSGIKARLVMPEIRNDDLVDLSETLTQTLYTDKNYERTVQRPGGYTVRHTLGKANLPCRASLRELFKRSTSARQKCNRGSKIFK